MRRKNQVAFFWILALVSFACSDDEPSDDLIGIWQVVDHQISTTADGVDLEEFLQSAGFSPQNVMANKEFIELFATIDTTATIAFLEDGTYEDRTGLTAEAIGITSNYLDKGIWSRLAEFQIAIESGRFGPLTDLDIVELTDDRLILTKEDSIIGQDFDGNGVDENFILTRTTTFIRN